MVQFIKDAVKDTVNKLLQVNNQVTTLEVKNQLIQDHSSIYWTQKLVSQEMGELSDAGTLEYITDASGNYRIYSLPVPLKATVAAPTTSTSTFIPSPKPKYKVGDKVVPFRKTITGGGYTTLEECIYYKEIREGRAKFLVVKGRFDGSNGEGLALQTEGTEDFGGGNFYSVDDVVPYVESPVFKIGDKVVPHSKSLNSTVTENGYSFFNFEQCPQAQAVTNGKVKFLYIVEIKKDGKIVLNSFPGYVGGSHYLSSDLTLYTEPVVTPEAVLVSAPATPAAIVATPITPVKSNKRAARIRKAYDDSLASASKVSKSKALELIKNTKGRFFSALFIKEDGSERLINCQYKSNNDLGHVIVREAVRLRTGDKNPIRTINIQKLKSLKIQGQGFKIN